MNAENNLREITPLLVAHYDVILEQMVMVDRQIQRWNEQPDSDTKSQAIRGLLRHHSSLDTILCSLGNPKKEGKE